MSTELRKLLDNAKGTTEHIVAIVLDIRGFTPFCKEEESLNVANFLKRVYIKIIDDYFPDASFYKPTGDGLLIVIPYTAESLKDMVNNTMKNCLKLLENFGKLCEGDEMIYFSTPDKMGIGISRGISCCISSDGTILDYSGRVINLASRLNDFARPSGVVFDSKLGLSLLPKEIQGLFLCDNVYVRGIAEDKPIAVYFTKQYTIIPPYRKQPLKEPEWIEKETDIHTYKEIKESFASGVTVSGTYLERKPSDEKQITIQVCYDLDLERVAARFYFLESNSKYVHINTTGAKYYVGIETSSIISRLGKFGLKDDSKIKMVITYPAVPKNP